MRDINSRKSYQDSSNSFRPSPFRIHVFRLKKTPQIQKKKQSKPKEPLHIVLKGPPPETRRWRPTSRAPVDFFVCKVRWALPKGALGRWPVEPPKIRRFSHGKSPFLIGKPSINGPFSMAMLNNQRVFPKHSHIVFGFFSSGLWETSTCNAPSLGFLMPKTIKVLRLIDVDSFYDWFCQLAIESFMPLPGHWWNFIFAQFCCVDPRTTAVSCYIFWDSSWWSMIGHARGFDPRPRHDWLY